MIIGTLVDDLTSYNTVVDLAQTNEPEALMIVVTACILCSLLNIAAAYLLYKTTKTNEKGFFVLTFSLMLIGSVAAVLFSVFVYQIFQTLAALPFLNVTDAKCQYLQTDFCNELNQTLTAADNKIRSLLLAINYVSCTFDASFNTGHIVFCVKYWALSLKIKSILKRENPATNR